MKRNESESRSKIADWGECEESEEKRAESCQRNDRRSLSGVSDTRRPRAKRDATYPAEQGVALFMADIDI